MTAPKPDPIPAVLDAYGIRDENFVYGPPPNLLTQDEIRRIRAALDRIEQSVEAMGRADPPTLPSGEEMQRAMAPASPLLPYVIGVASLAILAGLWWALR